MFVWFQKCWIYRHVSSPKNLKTNSTVSFSFFFKEIHFSFCFETGSLVGGPLPTLMHVQHTISYHTCTYNRLPEDEPSVFSTRRRRHNNLNISLEKMSFVVLNCIINTALFVKERCLWSHLQSLLCTDGSTQPGNPNLAVADA